MGHKGSPSLCKVSRSSDQPRQGSIRLPSEVFMHLIELQLVPVLTSIRSPQPIKLSPKTDTRFSILTTTPAPLNLTLTSLCIFSTASPLAEAVPVPKIREESAVRKPNGVAKKAPAEAPKPGKSILDPCYTINQSTNILWHETMTSRPDREELLGQKGCVLWMTGLSGSGESRITSSPLITCSDQGSWFVVFFLVRYMSARRCTHGPGVKHSGIGSATYPESSETLIQSGCKRPLVM